MAAEKRKSRLILDCEICGEPVVLPPRRYVELVRAGERPRCRRNGCERLCGAKTPRTSRDAQVIGAVGVLRIGVTRRQARKRRRNGALAKLCVSRCGDWRKEACCDDD